MVTLYLLKLKLDIIQRKEAFQFQTIRYAASYAKIKTFNSKQRIILIASSFDKQTLSAVAWLITNNVDISCFELSPIKIEDSYFIDINRILPPPSLEDFYVEVEDKKRPTYTVKRNTAITRTSLPGMDKLF